MAPNNSNLFKRNVPDMTVVLQNKCIGIAGCGGLGSNVAMLLARAGIGKLILGDFDVVELTNLNRQHYFQSDIGLKKVKALAKHLKEINPNIQLELHYKELKESDIKLFSSSEILIEAFDKAESKKWLIETWAQTYPEKAIICASGIAGYGKSETIKIIRTGNIIICGDGESEMKIGLSAPRVMLVAAMQANIAIELLMDKKPL